MPRAQERGIKVIEIKKKGLSLLFLFGKVKMNGVYVIIHLKGLFRCRDSWEAAI